MSKSNADKLREAADFIELAQDCLDHGDLVLELDELDDNSYPEEINGSLQTTQEVLRELIVLEQMASLSEEDLKELEAPDGREKVQQ